MNRYKLVTLSVVSALIAILLASALNSFTRVSDSALADSARTGDLPGRPNVNSPRTTALKNYLPIIFLNSANAGGAWLLAGNAGTNPASDFLGTTDNVTLTIRVSNTVAYRIAPAYDPTYRFAPNVIGGAPSNSVASGLYGATIAGGGVSGYPNVITGTGRYAIVAGGAGNTASQEAATIGGGELNTASGAGSFVGGGGWDGTTALGNQAIGDASTIGGGLGNVVSSTAQYAFIGGGGHNNTSASYATVGGGFVDVASGYASTVSGGGTNLASGYASTVSGGYGNSASGWYATVPGGFLNSATITYTLAAGYRAKANHVGTFVWADSTNTNFASTADNQFLVRANGGVGIGTNAPAAQLHVSSSGDFANPQVYVSQTNSADYARLRMASGSSTWDLAVGGISQTLSFYNGGNVLSLNSSGNPLVMGNGAYLTPGGAWTNGSDRNIKANFANVDSQDILARVSVLPISTWNYKAELTSVRHLGPMAQDFYAAFGLGADDKSITTVDESGVALAAIQGLNQIVQDQKQKIVAQQKQINDLEARVAALEQAQGQSQGLPLLSNLPLYGAIGLLALLLVKRR